MKVNFKSDFKFYLTLLSGGSEVVLPDCDFAVTIISQSTKYKATRVGGICTNCKVENAKLLIICNNHLLSPGKLRVEIAFNYPDADFADGSRCEVTPRDTGIVLVSDAGDEATDANIALALNYAVVDAYAIAAANGYKGTREEYFAALVSLPEAEKAAGKLLGSLDDINTILTSI